MSIFSLLSNTLRALAAYYELRLKSFEHDRREMSRSRIEALEDESIKLRNSGDPADAITADRVLARLITEKEYFKHLPSASATPPGGDESADG